MTEEQQQQLSIRQTLQNLKFQIEEEVRLLSHEYQCVRLQLIESKQKLKDITYLLEQNDGISK